MTGPMPPFARKRPRTSTVGHLETFDHGVTLPYSGRCSAELPITEQAVVSGDSSL